MRTHPTRRKSARSATPIRRAAVELLEARQMLTAVAAGVISGTNGGVVTYTTNVEWTDTSQPYNLASDVHVEQGATLTIAAGVHVTTGNGKGLYIGDDGTPAALVASGVTFDAAVHTYGVASGTITSSKLDVYSIFDNGASATLTLSSDTFNGGVGAHPEFVPKLAGTATAPDAFAPSTTVNVFNGRAVQADTTWPALPNLSRYLLINYDGTYYDDVSVSNHATLTIAAGVTVTSNDPSNIQLLVATGNNGGGIVANGVTFNTQVNCGSPSGSIKNSTLLQSFSTGYPAAAGFTLTGDQFQYASFDIGAGAPLTLSGNTFNGGVGAHPEFVPQLAGPVTTPNAFAPNTTVNVFNGRAVQTDTTWPALPNLSRYLLINYDGTYYDDVSVSNHATLTIANGVTVTSNDPSNIQLLVATGNNGGGIVANGVTFNTQVNCGGPTGSITNSTLLQSFSTGFPAAAGFTLTGNSFQYAGFDVGAGAPLTLSGNTFNGGVGSHPEFVPQLAGPANAPNKFAANTTVNVFNGRAVQTDTTWPALPNLSRYLLINYDGTYYDDVSVSNHATLTIANGVTVTSNDPSNIQLLVATGNNGGGIVANGVTFNTQVNCGGPTGSITNSTLLQSFSTGYPAAAGFTLTGDSFQYASFDVGAGAPLTLSANSFNGGVGAHPEFVPNLAGPVAAPNAFTPNTTVNVFNGRAVQADTMWPALPNLSRYLLINYDGTYYDDVSVRNRATLTIANGVTVASNDPNNIQLLVASDNTGGGIVANGVTFNTQVILGNAAFGSLQYDAFGQTLTVNSTQTTAVHNDAFGIGGVVAAGAASATIDLTSNYWGTTDVPTILSRITDHHTNANLPTVAFQTSSTTVLTTNPVLPDLTVSAVTPATTTVTAGQVTTVQFTVTNLSPVVAAAASGVTVALSSGSNVRSVGVADVPALAGGASYTGTATVVLPAAGDVFYAAGIPGVVTITVTADGFNQVIERFENNNVGTANVAVSVLPAYIAPLAGAVYSWDRNTGDLTVTAGTVLLTADSTTDAADPLPNVTVTGPTASLVVQTSQHLASLTDTAGGTVTLTRTTAANGAPYTLTLSVLSIGAGSKLDLTVNALDLQNTPLAAVTGAVAAGYGPGGNWAGGSGITSSAAAADPKHLSAVGVIRNSQGGSPVYGSTDPFVGGVVPGANDVLVRYTYVGDANLDGRVNGIDYGRTDAGYNGNGGLTGWFNGDFNYDGRVDGSDYTLVDNAFDTQGQPMAAAATAERAVDVAPTAARPSTKALPTSATPASAPSAANAPAPSTAATLLGADADDQRGNRRHSLSVGLQ